MRPLTDARPPGRGVRGVLPPALPEESGGLNPPKAESFFYPFSYKTGPKVNDLNENSHFEADCLAQPRPDKSFGQWVEGAAVRHFRETNCRVSC